MDEKREAPGWLEAMAELLLEEELLAATLRYQDIQEASQWQRQRIADRLSGDSYRIYWQWSRLRVHGTPVMEECLTRFLVELRRIRSDQRDHAEDRIADERGYDEYWRTRR